MRFSYIFIAVVFLALSAHKQSLAQSDNAGALPAIISLLLFIDDEDEFPTNDEDECISLINVGDVIFDSLDPECPSEGRPAGTFARYFSFTHPGGPLHVDLLNDFPTLNGFGFDPFLILRAGEARDGVIVGPLNDNGHENFRGAQIRIEELAQHPYTLQVTAASNINAGADFFNLSVYTNRVTAQATGRLNDTGIAFAGVSLDENSACNGTGNFANQDCNSGRDQNFVLGRGSSENDNDGEDGFSFLRVGSDGAPLRALDEDDAPIAPNHACVKDNVTGLMWEVKTNDGGLHDADHTYTWYNTDFSENGGDEGDLGDATCLAGTQNCNTQGYVAAVNAVGLCGYNDWRMPTVIELQGILNYQSIASDFSNPTIDTAFFPNARADSVWSSSPALQRNQAPRSWNVNFRSGGSDVRLVGTVLAVRLVRGGQ